MIQRVLEHVAFSDTWGRQMRFITGPRQCGKTTLAKKFLEKQKSPYLYYLWDLREVRNRYKSNELFFTEDSPPKSYPQWVCFDEIHKLPKWKNIVKGLFDATAEDYRFIVTGSAKLEIFKKAGDSLSGRYFTFRLGPLSLCEFFAKPNSTNDPSKIPATALEFIRSKMEKPQKESARILGDLLKYGGFPEPFLRQSDAFARKWRNDYTDTVIKEDIGELTRILDKEYLYDLYRLLPEMTGSHISEASIASHLQVSGPTVKNYLRRLEDFYLAFKIHPYSKNIKRSLLKAPKCYLYDWAAVPDEAKRFENYMAVEILSRTRLWQDASGENFSVHYVKNKTGEETDFLILKDKVPWLLLEAKLSDTRVDSHHLNTQAMLHHIPFVQVCRKNDVCRMESKNVFQISAERFFS